MSAFRSAAHRAWLTVVDQGVSSVTNLGVSLVAARYLGARMFGIFTAVFLLYVLLVGITRALASEPLSVRHDRRASPTERTAGESATGLALVIGALAVVVLLPLTIVLPDDLAPPWAALVLTLPGLLVQDTLRFFAFAAEKAPSTIRNDVVWLACVVSSVGALVMLGAQSGWTLLMAWGLSAHAAALISAWELRIRPSPSRAFTWLRQNGDLGVRYLGEFVTVQASGQLTVYIVGLTSGFAELAALRGAQLLFGPYHVLDDAVRGLGLAQLAAVRRRQARWFPRALTLLSLGMVLAGLSVGVGLLLLPDAVGRGFIGHTWGGARDVIVPLAAQKMALGAGVGAFCGLRVILAARDGFRVRIATSLVAAASGYTGALLGGARGAALGMAAGQALGAVLYWRAYRHASSHAPPRPVPAEALAPGHAAIGTNAMDSEEQPLTVTRGDAR